MKIDTQFDKPTKPDTLFIAGIMTKGAIIAEFSNIDGAWRADKKREEEGK